MSIENNSAPGGMFDTGLHQKNLQMAHSFLEGMVELSNITREVFANIRGEPLTPILGNQ